MFAWRRHDKGCSIDSIRQGQMVIVDSEMMEQVLVEMDNLLRECPQQSLSEVAEQIVKGLDKAEANE